MSIHFLFQYDSDFYVIILKAKKSFSKAIHLNPAIEELWEEDLKWTIELIKKKNKLKKEEEESQEKPA